MLPKLNVPDSLNYIAAFLTMDCNLNCSYCINDPEQRGERRKVFEIKSGLQSELRPEQWAQALARLPARFDLPITFQGGEPTIYAKGLGLGAILAEVECHAHLLTNLVYSPQGFSSRLRGQIGKFKRTLPYPSIRVSYHAKELDRLWKADAFKKLVDNVLQFGDLGLTVNADPAKSDVGIYMVDHPENVLTDEMKKYAEGKVPLYVKDFLGVHEGELYGQYAYPYSTDLMSRRLHDKTLSCECRTTELLIDPLGFVWGCHFYLYRAWELKKPLWLYRVFESAGFSHAKLIPDEEIWPVGHMLDPEFRLEQLSEFRPCSFYGRCIPCDTKFKRDRFATENSYRTSVQIRNIEWPEKLRAKSVILRDALH